MAFIFLWIAIFTIFFQPEYVFTEFASIEITKYSIFVAFIFYLIAGKKNLKSAISEKINIFFILFAIMQVVGSFTIWTYGAIMSFNVWLRFGIVYLLVVESITSFRKAKAVVLAIILGLCYLVYFFIMKHVVNFIPGQFVSGYGWFENANDLVLILATSIPLALLFVNLSKKFIVRLFFIVYIVMASMCILYSLSRGGVLSLLVIGVMSLFCSNKIPFFIKLCSIALLVGAIVTVGATNILSRRDLVPGRFTGDTSSENRIIQWRAGLRMIKQKPLFGVGRGEFKFYVQHYGGIKRLQPHNTLIQVFAETGIPGGVFYCLFAFYPFYEVLKLLNQRKKNEYVAKDVHTFLQFMLIALIGFWTCAFFGNRYNEYILYILVGIIVSVKNNIVYRNLEYDRITTRETVNDLHR